MPFKYVTLNDVCQYLAVDGTDTDVQADVEFLITLAEDLVELYCNTSFEYVTDVTYVYDGVSSSSFLHLKKPCASVSEIVLKDPDGVEITAYTKYILGPRVNTFNNTGTYTYVELTDSYFTKGIGNVHVTGNFGLETIPNSIKLAVYLIVKNINDQRSLDQNYSFTKLIDRSFSTYDKISYIPETARALLERWRMYDMDNYAI